MARGDSVVCLFRDDDDDGGAELESRRVHVFVPAPPLAKSARPGAIKRAARMAYKYRARAWWLFVVQGVWGQFWVGQAAGKESAPPAVFRFRGRPPSPAVLSLEALIRSRSRTHSHTKPQSENENVSSSITTKSQA